MLTRPGRWCRLTPNTRNPQDSHHAPIQRHRTDRRRYQELRGDAGPACQIPDGRTGEVAARLRPQDRSHLRRMGLRDRFSDPHRAEMQSRAGRSSSCCRTCSGFRCWSMPSTIASATARPRLRCSARFMSASTSRCRTASDISANLTGERMFVQSRVTDLKGKPLAGVPVDVWHADDDGYYNSQRPDYETKGPSSRARFITDADGRFSFAPSCRAAIRFRPTARSGR